MNDIMRLGGREDVLNKKKAMIDYLEKQNHSTGERTRGGTSFPDQDDMSDSLVPFRGVLFGTKYETLRLSK